ncbi:hypothetical protein LQE85_08600 [Stenotrophomonas rhizophila]|nr:hypothetical protein [Stenotrophomonas rhizophila]UQY89240.1 hypothetical protein LQE85_08600 [Stenotrophomonas rhizophila]
MIVLAFFGGVLAGASLTVAAAAVWHERDQAAHFDRILEQIKSLGPRA